MDVPLTEDQARTIAMTKFHASVVADVALYEHPGFGWSATLIAPDSVGGSVLLIEAATGKTIQTTSMPPRLSIEMYRKGALIADGDVKPSDDEMQRRVRDFWASLNTEQAPESRPDTQS